MASAGLIERTTERLPGRGRPRHRYTTTHAALLLLFATHERRLGPLVWRAIQSVCGDELAEKVLDELSQRLAERYRRRITETTPEGRLRQMNDLLSEEGVLVEVDEHDGNVTLRQRSCPFAMMFEETRMACCMDQMVMSHVVGKSVRRTSCRHDGDPCCVFEIVPEGTSGGIRQTRGQQRLTQFVEWVGGLHRPGTRRGRRDIYLDRLFRAFGQPGCLEVGGQAEFRVRKAAEDGGGVAFADYVWKPVVLVEMKRRGTDLAKHFRQAFDYWVRLVPDRPRYTVLCNFDEFWIYDFDVQMDVPVDRVPLAELPDRHGPLAFLFPTNETPVFGNDHEKVTREAADRLATCFNKLLARGVPRQTAQRFILQMLVALFADDIGLLERYFVDRLLDECRSPAEAYDLLGGLFDAMNTPGKTPGGRFKGVDYFNGGLFAEPVRLELYEDELNQLRQASKSDWSRVRPEIFGTIFEHSLGSEDRHAFGAHFTSPVDIMKIVAPDDRRAVDGPDREREHGQAAQRPGPPDARVPRARSGVRQRQFPLHRLPRAETARSAAVRADRREIEEGQSAAAAFRPRDRRPVFRHRRHPVRRRVGQGHDDDRPEAGDR